MEFFAFINFIVQYLIKRAVANHALINRKRHSPIMLYTIKIGNVLKGIKGAKSSERAQVFASEKQNCSPYLVTVFKITLHRIR